eukprot:jgi/Botrbrau1/17780/Bobra.0127s0033.1
MRVLHILRLHNILTMASLQRATRARALARTHNHTKKENPDKKRLGRNRT